MDGFENFDEGAFGSSTNPTQLDFGEGQEDIFAAAGMSMNSQSNFGGPSKANDDDLTPEEQEIVQRVESEMQEKKRLLFEKQNQEEVEKTERKQAAQKQLEEWK